jgi:type II secretory pathway component GspD/PulD (secretin)
MILVEIRCIEVSENDFQELGFDWSINSDNRRIGGHSGKKNEWSLDQVSPLSSNQLIRPLEQVIANVSNGTLINQLDIFPALFGTSYPFGKDFNFNLSLTVNAICQNTRTETLSAPKLLAESGAKNAAMIKLVKTYYFPDEWEEIEVEEENGGIDITPPRPTFDEATDVGIIFSVRARANPDNKTINLQLDPQIINYIGNDNYDITIYGNEINNKLEETERNFRYQIWMPVFTERSLSVKVNVDDGCTLVLGGITQNQMSTRVDKWPLLGDLPFIGRFFQSRAEVGTRQNMMMFVTARLMNTNGVPIKQNVEKGIPDFLR